MKAYKGFNRDMTCLGFQYAEGKAYETRDAVICNCGFHACMHPLGCFEFYPPNLSVYHEVEIDGEISQNDGVGKVAATVIKIGARLGVVEIVKAAIDFAKKMGSYLYVKNFQDSGSAVAFVRCGVAKASGERGTASATGEYGAAEAYGDYGAASATGEFGAALVRNSYAVASATGNYSAVAALGPHSIAACAADYAVAGAVDYRSAAVTTGDRSVASATGFYGAAVATNYGGVVSATGDCGVAAATGPYGSASAMGDYGAAVATSEQSAVSAMGFCGAAVVTNTHSTATAGSATAIAVAWSFGSRAKGVVGSHIVFADWRDIDGERTFFGAEILCIDGRKYKPDTWYAMKDGEVVECEK